MSKDFRDKVVIVTGASSGIGRCTAILFAQHGAKVVLCGRDEQRLSSALRKCQEKSGGHEDRFLTVLGDISDARVRRQIIQQTVDTFGRLDILVSSAGISLKNSAMTDATEASFDRMLSVNVKAGFFLILEAVVHLEKTNGCIVLVSSTNSTIASPAELIDCMFKAIVDHMTRTFALGLAPKGIRVNAINPSVVATNIARDFGLDEEHLKQCYNSFAELHPLNGRNSTLEEQANVILFLTSPGASFVTGQCIKVDGGYALKNGGN